jgi:hypothetical protein
VNNGNNIQETTTDQMAETPGLLGIYILSPERPFLAVPDIPGRKVNPAIKEKVSLRDLPFHYTR